MFPRHGSRHRNRAEDMTRAANRKQNQKTKKTDTEQGVEDRLQPYEVNYVDEEGETEKEGNRLQPNEGAAGVVATSGFTLIHVAEFIQLAKFVWQLFRQLVFRSRQGVAVAPVTAIF